MSDSKVQIDQGTAGIFVDSVAVTTTDGPVQRQRVAVADATNPEYNWVINADGSASISGKVDASGSVSVLNFPATQNVDITAGSVGVTNFPGTFAISNFPANQIVSGSVSVSGNVDVAGSVQLQPSSSDVGYVGTWTPGSPRVGQATASVGAIQMTSLSIPVTNGVLVGGMSTNAESVLVGPSTVTLTGSTGGAEVQPGGSLPFTCSNVNQLYLISAAGTGVVWWSVL